MSTGATEGENEWGAVPKYASGIFYQDSYNLTFNDNYYTWTTPPCQANGTSTAYLLQSRTFYCPVPLTLVYQASPPIGPNCPFPNPPPPLIQDIPKQSGSSCPSGCTPGSSNSGGADAGSSRIGKANPVDASHGNKFQQEMDYAGAGSNPIRFVRSYNSLAAWFRYWYPSNSAQLGSRFMGEGWSATYFQTLLPVTVTNGTITSSTVYAYRPDGRTLIFNQYQGGYYFPDGDVADSLLQTANGWQYQTADDTIETYDSTGRLVSIAARGSAPLTLQYPGGSGAGAAPSSITDGFGHSLQFAYVNDATGVQRLASITDPASHLIQYAYDTTGNLQQVTQADTSTRIYSYGSDSGHALLSVTDEASVQYATWTYTTDGARALTSQHAGGVDAYSFTYGLSGSVITSVTVLDPLNQSRVYPQQLLWGVNRMSGSSALCVGCGEDQSRIYDSNGNITSRTDFNGIQTTYAYDGTWNLETSRTEAYGTARARTITTTWNANFRQPALISEPNRTTGFTYDAMGNVLTKTVTDTATSTTRVWTYTYDSYGRMLTADGPRTDVVDKTTYAYYTCTTGFQCGQINTITNAASQVTTYNTYDAHGQPLTITDPNGVVTTLTYDARSRLKTRQVGSETTTFDYYPTGLLQKVTLPDTSYVQYTYDAAHRLTRISDGAGNYVSYTLDAMGNRTSESAYDPLSVMSRTRSRVYNALNQIYQDVGAAGTLGVTTTFSYDNNGNQTGIAAPLSRSTTNQYDELNRLKQVTDPGTGNTLFGYDANDNLTSVQDPRNLSTTYTYSGFGDLKTQGSPDTGTTTKTYDSGGNLATSTDSRSAISTYTYDTMNRVKTVAYKIGSTTDQTITYTYDAGTNGKGHLTGASDANHSMTWAYDTQGRVTSKGQTLGSVTKTVGYAYTNGDLTTLTTPSGQSVVYSYTNHRVTGITINGTTLLSNVAYEPFGPARGWTWGNATSEVRLHNTDGNTSQTAGLESMSYGYDNAFRITTATNGSNSALSWTYGYDLLDRLTSAAKTGTTQGWTYDANGNRLTQTGTASGIYTISGTSNRLSSITGTPARTYSYDNAGNALTFSTVTNTYYNSGRMKTAKVGSSTTTYVYNALGQRVKKSGGSAGTVLYAYDESGHLLGEYSSTGTLVQETIWLADTPVATIRPGTPAIIYYVHADQLNAPRMATRPSDNKVAWRWDTDPFGTSAPNQNPQSLGTFVYNLRFPGQLFDSETSINYNYFRDYDSQVGRYVESDPIGLNAGVNTYAYALNGPLKFVDPNGLQSVVGPNPGGPSSSPILPSTGGPGNMGPRPAYPDTTNSVKCAAECTSTASKGAKRCMSSCGFTPGGAALCRGGWVEWQSACLINCAGG